jgi:hypothetical protein
LSHDVFHHRFFHFLAGAETALAKALEDEQSALPPRISTAFQNWPAISANLHELFARGPDEAGDDVMTQLARLALETVEGKCFAPEARSAVRGKAHAIIGDRAVDERSRIAAILAEPSALLDQLDEMLAALQVLNTPLDRWHALERVQALLDTCRKFSDALSAIPQQLERDDGRSL